MSLNVDGKYTKATIYSDVEDKNAVGQIKGMCDMFYMHGSNIKVMPDYHAGSGCVVGTTMVINNFVVPNYVGVDIGCGMLVNKIGDVNVDVHVLEELDKHIRKNVPCGFSNNVKKKSDAGGIVEDLRCLHNLKNSDYCLALGSLGGGNHFIELNKDSYDDLYVVIHSGSRNLGKCVSEHYQRLAKQNTKEHSAEETDKLIKSMVEAGRHESEIVCAVQEIRERYSIPPSMMFLTGNDMKDYLHDIDIVQRYASVNRRVMMNEIVNKFFRVRDDVEEFETIHNYIDTDNMILRKGAVSAQKGETLIIPMNMKDGSLICIGKGNEGWNYSAPHGAGRIMSRTEAKAKVFIDDFKKSMEGIYTTSVGISTIDESPMAYKPMEEIIRNIGDTVEIVDRIKPIYNFKASGD